MLHPLRSHRRLNTARDTIETPKRSKPSEREYDSPPPASLTAFSFKLQAEATMLLGADEAEDPPRHLLRNGSSVRGPRAARRTRGERVTLCTALRSPQSADANWLACS